MLPGPERLLGFQLAATSDKGARMTIHTRTPDGTLSQLELTIEPYVAHALRGAFLQEIPDSPQPQVTLELLKQRMAGFFTLPQ